MIGVEDADGVAVVTLDHGKVNALDLELVGAIAETFRALDSADGPLAVVLTGAGRSFSAGVDLWRIVDGGSAYVAAYLPALAEAFEAVFEVGKPVVAAINGHAIAGGCVFAACCDYRYMADGRGLIGVPEIMVGVPFPVTALQILGYAFGGRVARWAVLDAGTHMAQPARQAGLVDEVAPADELLDRAIGYARSVAANVPADTYRFTKRQLQADVRAGIAARRPAEDPGTVAIWQARVADGYLASYLERTVGRRPS